MKLKLFGRRPDLSSQPSQQTAQLSYDQQGVCLLALVTTTHQHNELKRNRKTWHEIHRERYNTSHEQLMITHWITTREGEKTRTQL